MAAEICLSQLPALVEDPNLEFQVCFLIFMGGLLICTFWSLECKNDFFLNKKPAFH